jgi:hypothetical protein
MPAVQSNSEYIQNSANGITSSVSSAVVTCGVTKTTFSDSTSSCPTLEPNIVELFLGCCKELFRRVGKDAENIAKVGEGFVTLDNVMAGYATQLNMEVKSNTYAVGDVALTGSKETDNLTNSDVRKQIEAILDEKGSDFKLPDRTKKSEEDEDEDPDDTYYYYNDNSSGTPDPVVTPTTPETIPPTEAPTEVITDVQTEPPSEPLEPETTPATIPPTESPTEVQTQPLTEPKTQPNVVPVNKPTPNKKPSVSVPSKEPEIITEVPTIIDEPIIDEEPIIEEPIIEDEVEELPDVDLEALEDNEADPTMVYEPINIEADAVTEKKSGNGLGAAVAVVGATAAVAGAAIAANKYLKKKEEDGEDWGDEA